MKKMPIILPLVLVLSLAMLGCATKPAPPPMPMPVPQPAPPPVPAPPPPVTRPTPSLTIVNNTGYEIYYAFVFFGDEERTIDPANDLLPDQTIPNGGSAAITLPYPLSDHNIYHILLLDLDGDFLFKENVTVTAGETVVFTTDDYVPHPSENRLLNIRDIQ